MVARNHGESAAKASSSPPLAGTRGQPKQSAVKASSSPPLAGTRALGRLDRGTPWGRTSHNGVCHQEKKSGSGPIRRRSRALRMAWSTNRDQGREDAYAGTVTEPTNNPPSHNLTSSVAPKFPGHTHPEVSQLRCQPPKPTFLPKLPKRQKRLVGWLQSFPGVGDRTLHSSVGEESGGSRRFNAIGLYNVIFQAKI